MQGTFLYHGNTTENHGNITEMPRKITENHGKSRKITEGFFHANHGNSRIPALVRPALCMLQWGLHAPADDEVHMAQEAKLVAFGATCAHQLHRLFWKLPKFSVDLCGVEHRHM